MYMVLKRVKRWASYFLISFLFTIFPVVVTKQMYVFYVGVSLDIENSVFTILARACFQAICGQQWRMMSSIDKGARLILMLLNTNTCNVLFTVPKSSNYG